MVKFFFFFLVFASRVLNFLVKVLMVVDFFLFVIWQAKGEYNNLQFLLKKS